MIEPTTPGVTITLATNYSKVWQRILVDNAYTTASFTSDRITLVNNKIEQLYVPKYDEEEMYKGVLYSGIAHPYMIPSSSVSYGGSGGNLSDYVVNDTTGLWNDTKNVYQLDVTNNGDVPVLITFIRVSWVPDGSELVKKVYCNDAALSGTEDVYSGTWVYITNPVIIEPGDTVTFDIEFHTGSVQNKDFTIDFVLNDGSMETVTFST